MGAYDASTGHLRATVEKVAEHISQQLAKTPAGEQLSFINDVVNAGENAVAAVVNAAQDAVNAAVNAAHDAVNAIANIGESAAMRLPLPDGNIAQNLVDVVAAEARAHVNLAHAVAQVAPIAVEVAECYIYQEGPDLLAADVPVGGCSWTERAIRTPGWAADPKASAAALIKARRAVVLQQRSSLVNQVSAVRRELKSRIAAVAARI